MNGQRGNGYRGDQGGAGIDIVGTQQQWESTVQTGGIGDCKSKNQRIELKIKLKKFFLKILNQARLSLV